MDNNKKIHIAIMLAICLLGLLFTTGCSGCFSLGHCLGTAACHGCQSSCIGCAKIINCSGCLSFCDGCAEGCMVWN